MTRTSNIRKSLRGLVTVQGAIFIVCLINFIVRGIEVDRIDREIRAAGFTPEHAYPVEPFLLLVAGAFLLFNPWWASFLSLLASMRVIYTLGYLPWVAIHNAHGVPMFSTQAMEKIWDVVYQPRLEYPFQLALAVLVLVCACVLLTRTVIRRPAVATVGG